MDPKPRSGRGRDKSGGVSAGRGGAASIGEDETVPQMSDDMITEGSGAVSARGGRRGRGRQREPEAGADPTAGGSKQSTVAAKRGQPPTEELGEGSGETSEGGKNSRRRGRGRTKAGESEAQGATDMEIDQETVAAAPAKQPAKGKGAKKPKDLEKAAASVDQTVASRVTMGDTVGRLSTVNIEDATAKDLYFDSYAHHNIHATMIKDQSRTQAYRDAISRSKDKIQGKVVLDVGCGTGMFSMWAARAGAAHVYAVECSAIISKTREIIKANGFEDKVTLIHGRLEEITLPVDKVDVIISEWMGFGLLHQAMLDTVIVARDKYLRPGGLILPDKATLWLCGLEDIQYREEKLDYWNDVYGFDMSCVREKARGEPLIDVAPYEAICTKDCQVLSLDMYTCTKEQLEFEVPFRLIVSRNDYLTAWVIFFDVGFTGISPPRWFSTSPRTHPTHWCQAIFYLGEQLVVCKNEVVTGTLTVKASGRNARDIDYTIAYKHKGKADGERTGRDEFQMR